MATNVHVAGFKPPDEKWKQMKTAWDACSAAGVCIPKEVLDFFAAIEPDPKGVMVDLAPFRCVQEWDDGKGREGYEIQVDKLPKDVKVLRFYNFY